MDLQDILGRRPEAQAIHDAVCAAIARIGPAETRLSKSQVGFYRRHPFAATWIPEQTIEAARAPLVLSVYLKRRDNSERWKQVVEPSGGRFTHHLELRHVADVDDFVERCLAEAWAAAA